MDTNKPIRLIELLIILKTETDKSQYANIFADIWKEAMSLEFAHNPNVPFQDLMYKKLVQLSVREYIYLGQTEETVSNLDDVINILSSASILVR